MCFVAPLTQGKRETRKRSNWASVRSDGSCFLFCLFLFLAFLFVSCPSDGLACLFACRLRRLLLLLLLALHEGRTISIVQMGRAGGRIKMVLRPAPSCLFSIA
jgi:hypothetical protein